MKTLRILKLKIFIESCGNKDSRSFLADFTVGTYLLTQGLKSILC